MKAPDGHYVLGAYLAAAVTAAFTVRLVDLPLLAATAAADAVATLVVFAAGVRADNSSVYDPYWSAAPPVIGAYWLFAGSGAGIARVTLLLLIVVWGARLTINWAKRWAGLDDEDWRYREFRSRSGRWYWPVSFAAIHLFPTVAVFFGMMPVFFAFRGTESGTPVEQPTVYIAGILIAAAAVALETIADQQLRTHRRSGARGPCRRGVWAYARHPNYLGELGFWLGLYVASLGLGAPSWTAVGFVWMCGIFFCYSIPAMNRHLARKWRISPADAPAGSGAQGAERLSPDHR